MRIKQMSEEQIPEVKTFIEIQEKIDRLKAEHPGVFDQLEALTAEYNAALEAADKMVRAHKASCGPFIMYQTMTKYNAEKLYEEVGRDRFLELGGKISVVTTFDLDKAKFEAHIATGNALPAEVINVVKEVSPRYKKPEKISI
jgi:hypothetical protein